MSGRDYYNEIDPFAAAWLRELIAAGEIPAGDVDERSIEDVVPSDLVGYRHCHFFAGIGGWAYAMRLAEWPDDVPLWTGSCPCQPFSAAGQGGGFTDERHLWPAFFWLIQQCRPRYVCGEQVASADALVWWDLVATDLEGAGYACTAVDLPAASVGAPHKRSRLFWLADAEHEQQHGRGRTWRGRKESANHSTVCLADADQHGAQWTGRPQLIADMRRADVDLVADATGERHDRGRAGHTGDQPGAVERPERLRDAGLMADAGRERRQQNTRGASANETADGRTGRDGQSAHGDYVITGHGADMQPMADTSDHGCSRGRRRERVRAATGQPHPCGHQPDGCGDGGEWVGDTNHARLEGRAAQSERAGECAARQTSLASHWAGCIWLPCTDGKARPTQPGIQPLASRVPNRVGTLRGAGNAIVPQAAAEVLRAWREVMA